MVPGHSNSNRILNSSCEGKKINGFSHAIYTVITQYFDQGHAIHTVITQEFNEDFIVH